MCKVAVLGCLLSVWGLPSSPRPSPWLGPSVGRSSLCPCPGCRSAQENRDVESIIHPELSLHPGFQPLLAPYPATTLLLQFLQGCYVALRQVHHVNVIPHTCRKCFHGKAGPPTPISLHALTPRLTCPILCSIVITKDIQGLSSPDRHLEQRSSQLLQGPWH